MPKTKLIPNAPTDTLKAVLDVVTGILETERETMKLINLIGRQLNNTNEKVNMLIGEKFPGLKMHSEMSEIITKK